MGNDYTRDSIKVGDGVTKNCYSDRQAYTVVARTATTLTVQRDNAIKDPSFKAEFIVGGFSAHCVNQNEQKWTYESNPNAPRERIYWSEKRQRFMGDRGYATFSLGRHEYYDYNF